LGPRRHYRRNLVRVAILQPPAAELGLPLATGSKFTALDLARSVHTVVSAGFALGQFASGWAGPFQLSVVPKGIVRRECEVVWRKGRALGVRFAPKITKEP